MNPLIVPSVNNRTCIHQEFYSFSKGYGPVCGKSTRKNMPHGWLCLEHDLLLRGIVPVGMRLVEGDGN